MSCTTHRMPSRSVSVSQPAAWALCGRLVCTRSSEHILMPARAEYVAFEAHAKTVIVSYSEQSWSQQHFASHTPPVRSHSQI